MFQQPLRQNAGERRNVHLHEVREVAVQHALQRVAQHRMIAPDRKHAKAAEQIEIALIVAIVEILTLAALEANIEADGSQHSNHLLIQVTNMQCVAFGVTRRHHPRQVQSTRHTPILLLCYRGIRCIIFWDKEKCVGFALNRNG